MRVHLVIRLLQFAVGMLFMVFGISSQASAGTVTVTYTGLVRDGYDETGIFGAPGVDLAESAYSLVFKFDTSRYVQFDGPGIHGDRITGDGSAVLTINGHDYTFADRNAASMSNDVVAFYTDHDPTDVFQYMMSQSIDSWNASNDYAGVRTYLSVLNPDLSQFPSSVLASFTMASCLGEGGDVCSIADFTIPYLLDGRSSSFSGTLYFGSAVVATTPIPATLPLLVSALGGIGFLGWRRRKAALAA